ncbi:MAG: DUF402 domain-containing protein [Dehalococcoidia bacterium]
MKERMASGVASIGLTQALAGAHILYRGIHIDESGRGGPPVVADVKPLVVIEDSATRTLLWMPAGTPTLLCVPNEQSQPKPWGPGEWRLERTSSWRWDALFVLSPASWWATWLLWEPGGRFRGWYVNLQEPFEPTPWGLDHRDLQLDILVPPDRRWRWKDIDDLERCEALGVMSAPVAARTRAEGEEATRQIEAGAWPFTVEATRWRPDPEWAPPDLPANVPVDLAPGTFLSSQADR